MRLVPYISLYASKKPGVPLVRTPQVDIFEISGIQIMNNVLSRVTSYGFGLLNFPNLLSFIMVVFTMIVNHGLQQGSAFLKTSA